MSINVLIYPYNIYFPAFLIFVGPGRLLYATSTANTAMAEFGRTGFKYTFPFSIIPAFTGGVLQIVASIIIVIIRRDVKRRFEQDRVVLYDLWETKIDTTQI